jgi:2-aminobenzoate-CoA ligase
MRCVFLESMWAGEKVAPGLSVGTPLPGYEIELRDPDGHAIDDPDVPGRLAIRGPTGTTYWVNANDVLATRAALDVVDGWSLLDDAYTRDADGNLWFFGRLDDMIVTGGRQVAPVEVEESLADHPAVAEVAVVAASDELRGQCVAAVVKLTPGFPASADLAEELKDYVKQRLAGYKYPRQVHFVDELPKDQVGKLQRRRLREQIAAGLLSTTA